MRKQFLLLVGALAWVCATASAWEKPAAPASQPLATDGTTEQYLYNVGADGFLLGANDWGSRASVQQDHGFLWKIEKLDDEGHYALIDLVETRDNQWLRMFCDGNNSIWVDNNTGANNDKWTITLGEGNLFTIGNSAWEGLFGANVADNNRCCFTSHSENIFTDWYSVSSEEYTKYVGAVIVYNAAVALKNAIDEAKVQYPGIDLSAQEAVYNNESSTKEELEAAKASIAKAIDEYVRANLDNATLANPIEITTQIKNVDGSSITNWSRKFDGSGRVGGFEVNTWSVEGNPGNDGTNMVTPFLQDWVGKGSCLSDMTVAHDTITVKTGAYRITANVRSYNESEGAESNTGAYLFANNNRSNLSTQEGVKSDYYNGMLYNWKDGYETYAVVGSEGALTFGVILEKANFNWLAYKDFRIYFLGKSDESLQYALNNTECTLKELTEDDFVSVDLREAFNAALVGYNASASAEDIIAAIDAIEVLNPTLAANKAAWQSSLPSWKRLKKHSRTQASTIPQLRSSLSATI